MKASIKAAFGHIHTKRTRPWKGEEEVRQAWVTGLEKALGIHIDSERAKVDSRINNVFIEFKAPGLFKGSKRSAKFIEATEKRLLPYIQREAAISQRPLARHRKLASFQGGNLQYISGTVEYLKGKSWRY